MTTRSAQDSTPDNDPMDKLAAEGLVPNSLIAPMHFSAEEILERVADAFLILDKDWRIVFANHEACRINQKSFSEFAGNVHWEEWPASVGTELERQYRRSMEEQVEVHFEHHYLAGPYDVWLENHTYPTPDGLMLVYRDITTRKKAEEALMKSEERYRSLIEATAEIVWTNSPDGHMRGAQPGWSQFTGQSHDDFRDYGWTNAVHPEDVPGTVEAWQQSVAGRYLFQYEHRVRRHDGIYRTLAVRAVPVLEEDGSVREWVGIHTDVTERRAMEKAQEFLTVQHDAFLRDVLLSVTDGRLHLCHHTEELPKPLPLCGEGIPLSLSEGLWELRHQAQEAAVRDSFAEERWYDLITATSEAAMNAVVHAGGGVGRVCSSKDTVQVWVEDQGQGIDMTHLPQAALEKGYSSRGTLGHGMKMMLATVDALWLLTSSLGTTVVLEQGRLSPVPPWLRNDL